MLLRTLRRAARPTLLMLASCPALAMPTAATVPFTAAQAAAGRVIYGPACGVCHGAALQGGAAVALSGGTFARTWGDGGHLASDFFNAIAKQMPKNAPGSLPEADNLALTAFLLASNGYA